MHALITKLVAIKSGEAAATALSTPLACLHHQVRWDDQLHGSVLLLLFFISDTDSIEELCAVSVHGLSVETMEASWETESKVGAGHRFEITLARQTMAQTCARGAARWTGLASVTCVKVGSLRANTVFVMGQCLGHIF